MISRSIPADQSINMQDISASDDQTFLTFTYSDVLPTDIQVS
jgi:hypothetical protein